MPLAGKGGRFPALHAYARRTHPPLGDGIRGEAEQRQEHFNEALTRFFDLPVMLLFGIMLPWDAWFHLGWRGLAFALVLLLLRRMPAWLVLHYWMPWVHNRRDAWFAGRFGPTGAGSVFYGLELQQRTGLHDIWPAVSLAVAASVGGARRQRHAIDADVRPDGVPAAAGSRGD